MAKQFPKYPVADMVPFERGVVRAAVEKYKQKINSNILNGCDAWENIDPVRAVPVDGVLVITDGNNRVKAYQLCGVTEIPVHEEWKSPHDEKPYIDAAREHAEWRGFADLPVDIESTTRQKRDAP